MIFYHGTSALAMASIRKKGLIPDVGKGADTYAEKVLKWREEELLALKMREPGIYITRFKQVADWYARMAAYINHSKPVILEVDIPDEDVDQIRIDEAGDSRVMDPRKAKLGGRWAGSIPREWIKGQAKPVPHPTPLPTHLDAVILGDADP